MPDPNRAESLRRTILDACLALVIDRVPLPPGPPRPSRKSGKRSRSDAAREPVVAWLPLSVSQNRLAAAAGKTKESEIFGTGRAWESKNQFDDDLRIAIVQASVHEQAPELLAHEIPPSDGTIADRQRQLTRLVRDMSQRFEAGLSNSPTFLLGLSARAGIAATHTEREAAHAGTPSELWTAVAQRIESSRQFYRASYATIVDRFGLTPKLLATLDATLDAFTDMAAAAADGLGASAPYAQSRAPTVRLVHGNGWTPLGFLIATLFNQFFTIDGELPIPEVSTAAVSQHEAPDPMTQPAAN